MAKGRTKNARTPVKARAKTPAKPPVEKPPAKKTAATKAAARKPAAEKAPAAKAPAVKTAPAKAPKPEKPSAPEPRHDSYDVVVIGSGISGSVSAALMAKAGWKVLVVEQAEGPGGYARAFKRGPYTFDPCIHVTAMGAPGMLPDILYRYLGIRDRIQMIKVGGLCEAAFPGLRLKIPSGPGGFISTLGKQFSGQMRAFAEFVQLSMKMHGEAHLLPPNLSLAELDAAVEKFPTLFKYQKATLGEVLNDLFVDGTCAKALSSVLWPYLGLPPSRVSFLTMSQALGVHLLGSYHVLGGFQKVIDGMTYALQRDGGELVVGRRVTGIGVENGKVIGVTLEGGRQVKAKVVISNADALTTYDQMVGAQHLPEPFMKRLRRMEPSTSAFVVYAATTLDLSGASHETFIYKHWDHERTWRDVQAGELGGMWACVPTATDPSLAPRGEHLVIMTALAPYDIGKSWESERARYQDKLLDEFEAIYPGLKGSLTHVDNATPLTFERGSLNQKGAIYGWANVPNQTASKRLHHEGPVAGLYLAGHWTQPGTASIRCLVSGVHTAMMAIKDSGQEPPELNPTGETLARAW
jgi:prolycopene isomerase